MPDNDATQPSKDKKPSKSFDYSEEFAYLEELYGIELEQELIKISQDHELMQRFLQRG